MRMRECVQEHKNQLQVSMCSVVCERVFVCVCVVPICVCVVPRRVYVHVCVCVCVRESVQENV